jgi:hypothetical protein
MPAFKFKSILLHTLPDGGGWEIIGIPHSAGSWRTVIAVLDPVAGEDIAHRVASMVALNLSGKAEYSSD